MDFDRDTPETRAVKLRMRADLEISETSFGGRPTLVIKDPLSLEYFRLRPDELFVLRQLDGATSLDAIRQRYEAEFAPVNF